MRNVLNILKSMTRPYKPSVTLEDMIAYRVGDETTHTKSQLMNAVACALCETKAINCVHVARYLEVDVRLLSAGVLLETGLNFIDLIRDYRMHQVNEYIKEHPNANLDTVAQACGYASAGSLWRFFQRRSGNTPLGKKSEAGQELWLKWREDRKKGLR